MDAISREQQEGEHELEAGEGDVCGDEEGGRGAGGED